MRGPAVALCLLAGLVACKRQDMYTQDRLQTWDNNAFFRNKSAMQAPVAGSVSRSAPSGPVVAPETIDAVSLARGQERFTIFCTPCHGRAGDAQGMIVQRGFTRPPSFVEGKLRTAKAEVFYKAITEGYGAMYSFADRVSPPDRWAIIAYIRALQLSQNSDATSLPAEDRARVEASR